MTTTTTSDRAVDQAPTKTETDLLDISYMYYTLALNPDLTDIPVV
jgi:hypothetical protein